MDFHSHLFPHAEEFFHDFHLLLVDFLIFKTLDHLVAYKHHCTKELFALFSQIYEGKDCPHCLSATLHAL
jgi:hypothetical protein